MALLRITIGSMWGQKKAAVTFIQTVILALQLLLEGCQQTGDWCMCGCGAYILEVGQICGCHEIMITIILGSPSDWLGLNQRIPKKSGSVRVVFVTDDQGVMG
ncbi:MAG: hypothetical protein ACI957_002956, partial [Verrucomicrobiales bacterium]